jgi:hypothetical protein
MTSYQPSRTTIPRPGIPLHRKFLVTLFIPTNNNGICLYKEISLPPLLGWSGLVGLGHSNSWPRPGSLVLVWSGQPDQGLGLVSFWSRPWPSTSLSRPPILGSQYRVIWGLSMTFNILIAISSFPHFRILPPNNARLRLMKSHRYFDNVSMNGLV